jgi:hypothetical protein
VRVIRRIRRDKAALPLCRRQSQRGYTIRSHGRNWRVIDPAGQLVCITVYKKGAVEVVRRLAA